MCKNCKPSGARRIDKCMFVICKRLEYKNNKVIGSCCGHGKYPPSIIIKSYDSIFDLVSATTIPRTRRFYKRDKNGVYIIPEVINGG